MATINEMPNVRFEVFTTMNKVIEELDSVKPNAYSEEDKYKWIARLDGMISLEVYGDKEPVQYNLPKDADKELLVAEPFADIYVLYCAAMVDFHNREYNNYNNSAMMFGERLEAYKRYYIQRNAPGKARNFRNVMG